jgi:Uma2 family endonuclease
MKKGTISGAARKTRPPRLDLETVPEEQRFVIDNVTWEQYEAIADAFPDRPVRINYDDGWLEIMTISNQHERLKILVDRLVLVLVQVFGLRSGGFGSFTHKRKRVLKALEPDQCYYFANFHRVKGHKRIDLEKDPPPDLAVEVEVSRSFLSRMRILAALGVPELWRISDERVEIRVLREGDYEIVAESPTFPGVDLGQITSFLQVGLEEGDGAMMQAFEKWLRKQKRKAK